MPPSGHVVGIYARVDDSRGVFKAPANEVVQGITGLAQTLYQSDQDQLNPAPNNINVIRDFPVRAAGIRVWGARVITSDDNYKYVPVRRLLIFIEQSLNQGLQDVVFEPNAPQLWATVERLITNFLNDVWVSGAFQGATPAQSYFVRCDHDDDDAGRYRRRPPDRSRRRRAGDARRVRDHPDLTDDLRDQPVMEHAACRRPPHEYDPYRSFNFRVEIDGTSVAAFSEVSGLMADGDTTDYRKGNDPNNCVRKLTGLRKFHTPVTLKRGHSRIPPSGTGIPPSPPAHPTPGATSPSCCATRPRPTWCSSSAATAFLNKIEGPHMIGRRQ